LEGEVQKLTAEIVILNRMIDLLEKCDSKPRLP
jgi:hypothetical protein